MKNATALSAGLLLCGLAAGAVVSAGPFNVDILQAYDGPARPRGEVAVLALDDVGPVEINGVKIHAELPHKGSKAYELLPGHYELLVQYSAWRERGVSPLPISFDAQAGREYKLTALVVGIRWSPSIAEVTPHPDPRPERASVCWTKRALRGTIVEWDRKAHRFTAKDESGAQQVFRTEDGVMGSFRMVDGAWRDKTHYRAVKPGAVASLYTVGCKPDVLYAIRLEE